MKRVKYLFRQLIISAFILIGVGCASSTKTAEIIALTAAHHVSVYEQEVGKKIKSENDYYDTMMQMVTNTIKRLRKDEQRDELILDAKKFAEDNCGESTDKITLNIGEFMENSISSWKVREQQYIDLTKDMKSDLEANQKTLTMEKTKISRLKNKLTLLSDARSQKEMLTLMVAYAGEVKNELDSLQKSSSKANEIVDNTMNNIKENEKEKTDKKEKTNKADKNPGN